MTISLLRQQLLDLIEEAVQAGARQRRACQLLGLSVRTVQRWKLTPSDGRPDAIRKPVNKLSEIERQNIIKVSTSAEFSDLPPNQIVPRLADQGFYLACESTFYRILQEQRLLKHRHRSQAKKQTPPRARQATEPNQLYSWDITYLPTNVRGMFYYLYLFMDLFTRKIVAWQVYDREDSGYAADLLKDLCERENINPEQVVLHSDNGSPMKGATMLAMMQVLGIIPSFSRPRVSDDNPYSESLFRTLKYVPEYPEHFESLQAARDYMNKFTHWYNEEHYHSGINYVTPGQRHRGEDIEILNKRKAVYEKAKARRPERWSGVTRNWDRIEVVHLNPVTPKLNKATLAEVA